MIALVQLYILSDSEEENGYASMDKFNAKEA